MTIDRRQLIVCAGLIAVLILSAVLRLSDNQPGLSLPGSTLATPLYIGGTLAAAILLIRQGVDFQRMGFGPRLRWRHLFLGLLGIVVLQIGAELLDPIWSHIFGAPRGLQRFASIEGSMPTYIGLLAFSWTFAAFGEEIAFRIVLLAGLTSALGGRKTARVIAVIFQAILFGLVHLYQGPTGVCAATVNGLIYGVLTIAGRGAIWPAAIAHGGANTIGLTMLYLGM